MTATLLKKPKQAMRLNVKKTSLQELVSEILHEQAMQDTMVLFYNKPLLELQKSQGVLPKRIKHTFEAIYDVMIKQIFDRKRDELKLPKRAKREQIAEAIAKQMHWAH